MINLNRKHVLAIASLLIIVNFTNQLAIPDNEQSKCTELPNVRIDCHPEDNANQQECEKRQCCWKPVEKNKQRNHYEVPIATPWCFFPADYNGYELSSNHLYKNNDSDYDEIKKTIKVNWNDDNTHTIDLKRIIPSGLPKDIENISIQLTCSGHLLRMKVFDKNSKRFEPELPVLNLSNDNNDCDFNVQYSNKQSLIITRNDEDGAILLNIDLGKMIYSDQFIQITTLLNSPFLYGLGEHFAPFSKIADKWQTYGMFNLDQLPLPGGTRSYSGFPFYINLDTGVTKAHGVYLHNSNAIDVIVHPHSEARTAGGAVTFRTIGGILDLVILSGPKPKDVIVEYQQLVGKPAMPPRWSLGFHLCRYGYKSLNKTRLVWERTRAAKIPFDVQWNDIDYMEKFNDFTYDKNKFAGLPEFVRNDLHKNDMKYMILFDPGVSDEDNYEPYSLGVEKDIFVKTHDGKILVGKVWNSSGRTVFPDFSNNRTIDYWSQLFVDFHKEIPFDGAWIDMNDISNFVDGSLNGCPNDSVHEDPPYKPGSVQLAHKTLCMTAKHRAGIEYDVHNLYSFYEAIATYKALELARPNTRPFIISRSTYSGQGKYSGHWSGDVRSDWSYLKWSIPSLIEHSMYGFQMMGADICGFAGNTNVELCARWHTLGSFYTFTRNHNDDVSIDQDPVALGPVVVSAARRSLLKRYTLLPYLYSLMYRGHLFGEPSVRSVVLEYYLDPEALQVEDQFLWGQALMISPIVEENTKQKSTYLPQGVWYETNLDLQRVPTKREISFGQTVTTDNIEFDDLILFYRGGHIIPVYEKPQMTVAQTVQQPFGLQAYLNQQQEADGELFDDDGDNVNGVYNHIKFSIRNTSLVISMDRDEYSSTTHFNSITIYGLKLINGSTVNKILINGESLDRPFEFDRTTGTLRFNIDTHVRMNKRIAIEWQ